MFGDILKEFHRPGLEPAGFDELDAIIPEVRSVATMIPTRDACYHDWPCECWRDDTDHYGNLQSMRGLS